MKRATVFLILLGLALGSAAVGYDKDRKGSGREKTRAQENDWTKSFDVNAQDFVSTGRNRYFILEPGYRLVLKGKEEGKSTVVTITVLDETKMIDGVSTRVVQEDETHQGRLVESTRDYFAMDSKTNDVYYFGEDVNEYKAGKLAGHEGSWLSGSDGAHYGMMMPGTPRTGFKHYQEVAPGVGMDRAEIVGVSEEFATPAGTFKDCVKVRETNPLEPGDVEYKIYAPAVGVVKDGGLKLVEYGFVKEEQK